MNLVERTGGGHWHPSCPDAVVAAGGGAAAVARPRYVVLIGRDGKGLLDLRTVRVRVGYGCKYRGNWDSVVFDVNMHTYIYAYIPLEPP